MKGRTYRYFKGEALFPFGHGLSYTTFTYGQAKLVKPVVKTGNSVELTIPVTNTGKYDGEEVIQVYLNRPADVEGPSKTLRAFQRVFLKAGQKQDVKIQLNPDELVWFDTNSNTMRCIPGEYKLLYGGTSDSTKLHTVSFRMN